MSIRLWPARRSHESRADFGLPIEAGDEGERHAIQVLVKASQDSEAGKMPSKAELAAMGKYNEELVKAGVMLASRLIDHWRRR